MAPERRRWPVLVVVLIVLLIGGGIGFPLLSRYTPGSFTSEEMKATATALTSAHTKAAVTLTSIPLTPTITPLFQDTLTDNTNGWCLTPNPAFCFYKEDGLHLLNAGAGGPSESVNTPTTSLDFRNFDLQVEMNILKGAGGGIFFRYSPTPPAGGYDSYYYYQIGSDGSYELDKNLHVHSPPFWQKLRSGSTPAIHAGFHQTNLVEIIAHGSTIDLYVNQQKLASVSDNAYAHGGIALSAADSGHPENDANPPVEVVFSHLKVWAL